MKWKVIEVEGGTSKRRFAGTEADARVNFELAVKAGTQNKLILRDEKDEMVDSFVPEQPEGKGITGMPTQEIPASLPPELLAAAAKVRQQVVMNEKQAQQSYEATKNATPPPGPPPTSIPQRAIAAGLRWLLRKVS